MRHRPLPRTAALLLGVALAWGGAPPASAAGPRLKLVSPTTESQQWPVNVNGWWGLIDQTGNLNTWPQLDWIGIVVDGKAPAARQGRFGVIDGLGQWRVAPQYDHVDRFAQGHAVVRRAGKAGFINAAGKEVLSPQLVDARRFSDGLAAVRSETGCGYIDRSIRVVVPPIFAAARSLKGGLGVVATARPAPGSPEARALEKLAGAPLNKLIDAGARARPTQAPTPDADPDANPDVNPEADPEADPGTDPDTETASQGAAWLWGCVNRAGRLVWLDRTGRVEAMGDFGELFAPVRIGGRWGYINRAFRIAIDPHWDEVRPFVGGYAAVRQGEKWGYINQAGRLAIEPRWDQAFDFDEKLALVREGEHWGYIDVSGRVAIEPQFTQAEAFFRGRARVNAGWDQRPDAFGYLNVAGQIVFDPRRGARGIVDIRRGGPGEIAVNSVLGSPRGSGGSPNSRRSRVVHAPPPRPTPALPQVVVEHLYDDGLSIHDPPRGVPAPAPHVYEEAGSTPRANGPDAAPPAQ